MKSLLIVLTLFLGTSVCVVADKDADFAQRLADRNAKLKNKVVLNTDQLQALVVATRAFEAHKWLNEEQRKLHNYKVWIVEGDGADEIVVSFLAIPHKEDEGITGGNFDYAMSMNFIIDSKTFVVKKVVGSR
jgi:hypothetical protein